MNLFHPPFRDESFDLVISNGVLHHTADPRRGFESIARMVAAGGFVLIGLYRRYGRLITDARRVLLRWTHGRLKFLDPTLRATGTDQDKKTAWYRDQYQHPHQSKHSIREVVGWFDDAGFDYVSSIPDARLGHPPSEEASLLRGNPFPGTLELALSERLQSLGGYREGGLFIVIGKRR